MIKNSCLLTYVYVMSIINITKSTTDSGKLMLPYILI
jgi:hypothetical protein